MYWTGVPPNVSATAATVNVNVSLSFSKVTVSLTAYPWPGFLITTAVDADVDVVIWAVKPVPEPDVLVWLKVWVSAVTEPEAVIVSSEKENTEFNLSPVTPPIVIFWLASSYIPCE